jgi:prepilin-type N-terminal cleavage/methylation domain-containing protein
MRKAFTLAEVLITIGIIGVVAAITIPNLITAYQKKVTAMRLKQNFAIFSQVIRESQADNGEMSGWPSRSEMTALEFEKQYILPYLKNVEETKSHVVYALNKRINRASTTQSLQWFYNNSRHYYLLQNGAVFTTGRYSLGDDIYIAIDINGKSGPNIMGIDVFMFNIGIRSYYEYKRDKFTTGTDGGYTIDSLMADSSIYGNWSNCNATGTVGYGGARCAALIEKQGWKITKDYPW